MAKKSKKGDGGEGEEKKGKKKLLVPIVVAVAVGAGGYMYGSKSSAAPVTTTTTTLAPALALGPIVDLPAVNLNLDADHFLRVALSLALKPGSTPDEVKNFNGAVAKDLLVSVLSGRTKAQLEQPEGRDSAKKELTDQIERAYGELITAVFFTDFVMQ